MSASHLAGEARYLHRALFAQPISEEIVARYIDAHAQLFPETAPSTLLQTVLARRLDAEAVELVLRRRAPANPLTRKFQVLCYLTETLPAYRANFYNDRTPLGHALRPLLSALIHSGWKSIKGTYLVKRHGLR
jgi:hypothetical protein